MAPNTRNDPLIVIIISLIIIFEELMTLFVEEFISSGYGGRASDKFITMNSGILDYLRPGDEVMADRGFLIRDLLFERRVKLVLPAFTRGGSQLTEEQVTATRRIANVRIHVERAIRRLRALSCIRRK